MIKQKLEKIVDNKFIIENAPMNKHTSFKAGGHAEILVEPQSIE